MDKELANIIATQKKILDKLTVISFWQEHILKWIEEQNVEKCKRNITERHDQFADEFTNNVRDSIINGSRTSELSPQERFREDMQETWEQLQTPPSVTFAASLDQDELVVVDWRTLLGVNTQLVSGSIDPNAQYEVSIPRDRIVNELDVIAAPTYERFAELYCAYRRQARVPRSRENLLREWTAAQLLNSSLSSN